MNLVWIVTIYYIIYNFYVDKSSKKVIEWSHALQFASFRRYFAYERQLEYTMMELPIPSADAAEEAFKQIVEELKKI